MPRGRPLTARVLPLRTGSHNWANQDAVHTLKRQLQLLLPGVRVFLDVDDLERVDDLKAYVASSGAAVGPAVYHVDPLTGRVTLIEGVGVAGGMVFGRDERLYVLDRDRIRCYRPDDDDMLVPEVQIPIPSPHTNGAIAFDDETDEIVVLSLGSRSILRFASGAPTAPPVVFPLQADIVLTPPVDLETHSGGAATRSVSSTSAACRRSTCRVLSRSQ